MFSVNLDNPNAETIALVVIAAVICLVASSATGSFGWRSKLKRDIDLYERLESIAEDSFDRDALYDLRSKIFTDLAMKMYFQKETKPRLILSTFGDPLFDALLLWIAAHCVLWALGDYTFLGSMVILIALMVIASIVEIALRNKAREDTLREREHNPPEERIGHQGEREVNAGE